MLDNEAEKNVAIPDQHWVQQECLRGYECKNASTLAACKAGTYCDVGTMNAKT